MQPFDPTFALTLAELTQAAYDFSRDKTISLPDGWTLRSNIIVDLSVADAYAEAQALIAMENDNWGISAVNGDVGVIALRGTETPHQWLIDFDAVASMTAETVFPLAGKYKLHRGFYGVFQTIRASIAAARADLLGVAAVKRLVITGHSLGAALALIAGAALGCETWTFAGPRVFASAFPFDCYRIVNCWDIVPHVPLPPLYNHKGLEKKIDGGFNLGFLATHGLVSAYIPGIKKLCA